ncbi:hypothetical protein KVQ86_24535, partial [Escherichia coli]
EYIQTLSHQAKLLVERTDNRASQGIHDFTQELQLAYAALLDKPSLLHSDYAFELFGQAHQEFIHLFDTLAAGQRVSLSEDAQQIINNLSAFVQQDIEALSPETDTTEAVTETAET